MEWLHQQTQVAFAALAAIDPAIMNAILIGSIGFGCVLCIAWLIKKGQEIPFIRRWGEAREMKQRQWKKVRGYIEDMLQAGLDEKRADKHITIENWEEALKWLAHRLEMPDLIPPRNVETVKAGIRERLKHLIPKIGKIPGPKPGEVEVKAKKVEASIWAA